MSGIFGIIALILLISPFVINSLYQRRARKSVDEMLRPIPEEYNKQIRANAYICLIRRGIVGLWILLGSIYWIISFQTINYYVATFLFVGLLCIVWGVVGFRGEKKRLLLLD